MITPEDDTIVSPQRPGRRRWPRWLLALAFAPVFVAGILIGATAGSSPSKTPAPAPAVTVTQPGVDTTETVTATPQPQPGQVLLKHSGSGNWNSPPFEVSGDSPQLRVTYSYSGNSLGGTPDNFSADIANGSDDQLVANDIASSGGKTTNIYPDTSFGGSTSYHLEVSASGSWSFTITEVS